MGKRRKIDVHNFNANPIKIFTDWMLLTSGDVEHFNSMTIAWGSIGSMWHFPVFIVGVRPERYTFDFMESSQTFTVCKFSKEYKNALQIMGTTSGRDINKIQETGLTPVPSHTIATPSFKEAELVFECRTEYSEDLKMNYSREKVKNFYHERNYHRMYIGVIQGIYGIPVYDNANHV